MRAASLKRTAHKVAVVRLAEGRPGRLQALRLALPDTTMVDVPQRRPIKSQAELDTFTEGDTRHEPSDLAALAADLLHDDEHFCVLDKTADVRMDGDFDVTCAKLMALRHALPGGYAHHHCHQLDFATSGALLYAKNAEAAACASVLFERRRVAKAYLALLAGHLELPALTSAPPGVSGWVDPQDGRVRVRVDAPIAQVPGGSWFMETVGGGGDAAVSRPDAKEAVTVVTVLALGTMHGRRVTKVLLEPTQGRRHQLRLHTAALGCPIVGDASYGGEGELVASRMMLHAWRLDVDLPWLASGGLPRGSFKAVHRWVRGKAAAGLLPAPLSVRSPDPFLPGAPHMQDLALEAVGGGGGGA